MPDMQCPVCSSELKTAPKDHENYDASFYDCPQCGKYVLEGLATVNREPQDTKQLISAFIRLQNKHGNNHHFIGVGFVEEDWFKNLRNVGLPQTVHEKLNELLKAYADIVKDNYGMIVKALLNPTLVSAIAAKDMSEILALNKFLSELGYVEVTSTENNKITITAKGWQRIDELSKPSYSGNLAFIAMWYDSSLASYLECVKKAIDECGYKPIIIDDIEFNDFIMDEVIQYIRQARFLIADLTCLPEIDNQDNSKVIQGVRGGVYWESGMAYGLGKTVIQTCRNDDCSRNRRHFDLNQYQTIFWKQEELTTDIRPLSSPISDPTFTERLAQRILATVGKGNYFTAG